MKMPVIAMLSDFGDIDPFVGIMKGVILTRSPQAQLVDITHAIPPGDVLRAAVELWQVVPYFPAGTTFLCVVDPGVGSGRKPVILEKAGKVFVGPDNGLFTFAAPEPEACHEISKEFLITPGDSTTFHGRDIFSPAAAVASQGRPVAEFGPTLDQPISLEPPRLRQIDPQTFEGEILYDDHFGNLLTSLGRFHTETSGLNYLPWLRNEKPQFFPVKSFEVVIPGRRPLPLARTFADIPPGEVAGVIGSTGLVEIAANQESAASITGLRRGDRVKLII